MRVIAQKADCFTAERRRKTHTTIKQKEGAAGQRVCTPHKEIIHQYGACGCRRHWDQLQVWRYRNARSPVSSDSPITGAAPTAARKSATAAARKSATAAAPSPKASNEEVDHPKYLTCPLTLELFEDPVATIHGHTYERKALERALAIKQVDPLTRAPLTPEQIFPNISIRHAVEKYRELAAKPWWES